MTNSDRLRNHPARSVYIPSMASLLINFPLISNQNFGLFPRQIAEKSKAFWFLVVALHYSCFVIFFCHIQFVMEYIDTDIQLFCSLQCITGSNRTFHPIYTMQAFYTFHINFPSFSNSNVRFFVETTDKYKSIFYFPTHQQKIISHTKVQLPF